MRLQAVNRPSPSRTCEANARPGQCGRRRLRSPQCRNNADMGYGTSVEPPWRFTCSAFTCSAVPSSAFASLLSRDRSHPREWPRGIHVDLQAVRRELPTQRPERGKRSGWLLSSAASDATPATNWSTREEGRRTRRCGFKATAGIAGHRHSHQLRISWINHSSGSSCRGARSWPSCRPRHPPMKTARPGCPPCSRR